MRLVPLLSILSLFLLPGCVQSLAVSTVGGIIDEGFGAFTEESDLTFAEQALPGNIKLLEVMLKNDPENRRSSPAGKRRIQQLRAGVSGGC